MVTKTLTIMEDAYTLLLNSKLEDESFSDVVRRVCSGKKKGNLMDFFGIISDSEGEAMLRDLRMIKKANIRLQKEELKNEGFGYHFSR